MTNRSIIQHGTQTTGFGVMIGRCSLDSQHGGYNRRPANVGCSFSRYTNDSSFRYTNDEQIDQSHQRPQRRKWSREDNKVTLYCYFRSNPRKRGLGKRMIEIRKEFARFKTTNQRLADQVRTITKNGWFSDLEILEIHQPNILANTSTVS